MNARSNPVVNGPSFEIHLQIETISVSSQKGSRFGSRLKKRTQVRILSHEKTHVRIRLLPHGPQRQGRQCPPRPRSQTETARTRTRTGQLPLPAPEQQEVKGPVSRERENEQTSRLLPRLKNKRVPIQGQSFKKGERTISPVHNNSVSSSCI
jgi:hypothetical protein